MLKSRKNEERGLALHAAFSQMLEQPGIWTRLKLAKQSILNMRVRIRKGDHPSIDLMHAWLRKTGWKRVVEEAWTLKTKTALPRPPARKAATRRTRKASAGR